MFVYNYRAEVLPSSYPLLHPRSNKFNTGILEVTLAQVDQGETFNDKRIAMVCHFRTTRLVVVLILVIE